jgi:hypothetical protein
LTWTPARVLTWRERLGSSFTDGVQTAEMNNWAEVADLASKFASHGNYIWRGHSRATWLLEPSLDRLLRQTGKAGNDRAVAEHLNRFEFAVRGRRGASPTRLTKEELWALGQHYGLATPLLDWTASPFVAAFFAFEEKDPIGTPQRSIFALDTRAVFRRSAEISGHPRHGSARALRIVRPRNHHDARLISQAGLFTRGPNGVDVEKWVRTYFRGSTRYWALIRINLPSSERAAALKALNRMNINHLSLFPDLSGAARYCDMALEVTDYADPEGRIVVFPETEQSLDAIAPPEPRDFVMKGRELDEQQLLGISRTNAKLLAIEKKRMAAVGQTEIASIDMQIQPGSLAWEGYLTLLRCAGIAYTAELEDVIAEIDADSLIVLFSEVGFEHRVRPWDAMLILAIFAAASRMDETAFDKFFSENKLVFAEGSAALRARMLRLKAPKTT